MPHVSQVLFGQLSSHPMGRSKELAPMLAARGSIETNSRMKELTPIKKKTEPTVRIIRKAKQS